MDLDLTAYPKGDRQLREIVDYIRDNGDRTETHFLEAKSDVDVRSRHGQAKVAKFILGAANRMPDVAAKYFDGHALMLLGVAYGAVEGIDQIDEKDLRGRVGQYTGSGSKPGWEIRQLPISGTGKVVLVVVVDPPETGAEIWPCHREFSDGGKGLPLLRDGAIYVRPSSETREANAAEISDLVDRARATAPPDADLDVVITGVVHRIRYRPGLREEWIADARKHLSGTGTAPYEGQGEGPLFRTFSFDDRSARAFAEELDAWEYEVTKCWAKMVLAAAWVAFELPTIQIVNRGQTFMRDVEVQVTVPTGVIGMTEPEDSPQDLLPDLPRARGEVVPLSFGSFALPPLPAYRPGQLDGIVPDGFTLENPMRDGVTASYTLRELRPRPYEPEVGSFGLFASTRTAKDTEIVTGSWLLTADHHRNYQGTFMLPVKELDVTELLTRLLYDKKGISRRS